MGRRVIPGNTTWNPPCVWWCKTYRHCVDSPRRCDLLVLVSKKFEPTTSFLNSSWSMATAPCLPTWVWATRNWGFNHSESLALGLKTVCQPQTKSPAGVSSLKPNGMPQRGHGLCLHKCLLLTTSPRARCTATKGDQVNLEIASHWMYCIRPQSVLSSSGLRNPACRRRHLRHFSLPSIKVAHHHHHSISQTPPTPRSWHCSSSTQP